MRTCVLIRHLPTDDDLAGRISHPESSLPPACDVCPEAWDTMRTLVRTLRLSAVYCADNFRSVETVARLGLDEMLPMHREPRLRNIHVADWVGKTERELAPTPEWQSFFTHPLSFMPKSGESFESVVKRVDNFLDSVPEGEVPLIVSHTTPLQIILFRLINLPLDRLWAVEFFHNTYTIIQEGTLSHFNIELHCKPNEFGMTHRLD